MLIPHEIPVDGLLRLRRRFTEALQFASLVVSFILWDRFGFWLATVLGVPTTGPMKGHLNSNLWCVLFIAACVPFVFGSRWITFVVLAALLRWRERWTTAQIRCLLLRGDLPAHWYKPSTASPCSSNQADGLAQASIPPLLVAFVSTLAMAATGYTGYGISHHVWLCGRVPAFFTASALCPAFLYLSVRDLVRLGFGFGRIYCAVTSLLGCLLVGTVFYLLPHRV